MNNLYQAIEGYPNVWRSIFVNVMERTESDWKQWMKDHGKDLVRDPATTLHEEAWFWLCPTVVGEFGTPARKIDYRQSENKMFYVLAEAYSNGELENTNWESLRGRCKEAIVYVDGEI